MRVYLAVLVGVLCGACASLPARVGQTIAWEQAEDLATASTNRYDLSVDARPPVSLAVRCVSAGTTSLCTARLPVLEPGVHTLVIAAVNEAGIAVSSERIEVAR